MQRTEGLGRDFAQDQHDERQFDHADRDIVIAAHSKRDEADQCRGHDVDDGAQQQNETNQSIGIGDRASASRAPRFPALGAVPEPVAVQAHQSAVSLPAKKADRIGGEYAKPAETIQREGICDIRLVGQPQCRPSRS